MAFPEKWMQNNKGNTFIFDPLLPPFVKDHIQQQKQIWDIMCIAAIGRIQYIYCILVLTALSHIMQLPSSDFSPCYDNDHPTYMINPSYYEELRIIHSNFTNRNVTLLILGGEICWDKAGVEKSQKMWKFPTKILFFPHRPLFSPQMTEIFHELPSLKQI